MNEHAYQFRTHAVRVSSRFGIRHRAGRAFASTAVFASNPQGTFEKTLQVSGPVES